LVVVTTLKKKTWWLAEPINLLLGGGWILFWLLPVLGWCYEKQNIPLPLVYGGTMSNLSDTSDNKLTQHHYGQKIVTVFIGMVKKGGVKWFLSALATTSAHNSSGGRMTKQ
jgi:hypothetical protein